MERTYSETDVEELHCDVNALGEVLDTIIGLCQMKPDGTWFVPIFMGGQVQVSRDFNHALHRGLRALLRMHGG